MKTEPIWTRNFILLIFSNLLVAIAFYFLIPTLPEHLTHILNSSNTDIGIILSIYTISALIIRPITGYFIDRSSKMLIYLISLLFFAIVFHFYALATTFAAFLMLRFIHGLTWGVSTTTGSTIIVDILPFSRRGEGLGYFGLSMTIAMALGPLIALLFVGSGQAFESMFVLSGIICLGGFILALFVKYPRTLQKNTEPFSIKGLLDRKSIPFSLILMVVMITYGGMLFYIKKYSTEIGITNPALFFVIFAIGITASRLFAGRIFDHSGPRMLTITGLLLMTFGFVILSTLPNAAGFYGAAFSIGLGSGIIFPVFQAMVNNVVPPQRRGAANSTLFTFVDLGIGLGMLFTGILEDYISLAEIFLLFSALNILALAAFLLRLVNYYKNNKLVL